MTPDVADARAVLSRFTPDEPLWVTPIAYRAMLKEPGIADMMDRVRVVQQMPVAK